MLSSIKKNGILRVAVPDLEALIRLYLKALELSLDNSQEWKKNYEWLMIEMFDQMVRNKSGGEMLKYFENFSNADFVLNRCGGEAKTMIDYWHLKEINNKSTINRFKKTISKTIKLFANKKYRHELILKIFFKLTVYNLP